MLEVTNPQTGRSEAGHDHGMVDTGASNTHVSSALGGRLGLRGVLAPFVVGSHGGRIQEYEVMEYKVLFRAIDRSYQSMMKAKCYPNPCGAMEVVDWRELQKNWEHLKRLPLPETLLNRKVEVILGMDCLDAI